MRRNHPCLWIAQRRGDTGFRNAGAKAIPEAIPPLWGGKFLERRRYRGIAFGIAVAPASESEAMPRHRLPSEMAHKCDAARASSRGNKQAWYLARSRPPKQTATGRNARKHRRAWRAAQIPPMSPSVFSCHALRSCVHST